MRGNVYIVSAPSGSGKSTLLQHLLRTFKDLAFSISYTTRLPRGGERNGVEYFFVGRKTFLDMVEHGKFLEWAEYHGHLYGTALEFVESRTRSGKDVILDIDVQGAMQVKSKVEGAIAVFVLPPSFAELERRLRERKLEPDETVRRRLEIAKREILRYREYDYIIVNDVLENSLSLLEAIVRSSSARPGRQEDRIRDIIASFGGQFDQNS